MQRVRQMDRISIKVFHLVSTYISISQRTGQLESSFRDWLANDRKPCPAINKLRNSTSIDPVLLLNLIQELEESTQHPRRGQLQAQTSPQINHNASNSVLSDRNQSTSSSVSMSPISYNPLVRHMLEDCLKDESDASLDPSRYSFPWCFLFG